MAMTDEQKIAWFDETMDWIEQYDTAANARKAPDESADAPNELWYDMVDQFERDREL